MKTTNYGASATKTTLKSFASQEAPAMQAQTFKFIYCRSNFEGYTIEAISFQEACRKMSKLHLLKGHLLRSTSGKWIPVEYIWGRFMPKIVLWAQDYREIATGCVGDSFVRVYKQPNGKYALKKGRFHTDKYDEFQKDLSLHEIWKEAIVPYSIKL